MKLGNNTLMVFLVLGLMLFAFGCINLNPQQQLGCSTKGPVCGIDNKEYQDECAAKQANVPVAYYGSCISCVDEDKGKVATESSYITVNGKRYDDYCLNGTVLMEYYCDSNTSKEGKKTTIDCTQIAGANACENGACVFLSCNGPSQPDLFKKANASYGSLVKTDECKDGKVVKYYCANGMLATLTTNCPTNYVCDDGICIANCTSTASNPQRFDIYKKDSVTKGNTTQNDYCLNSTHVVDYYCSNNEIKSQVARCPDGYSCVDGACISSSICFDSDYGPNVYNSGYVSKGLTTYWDYCSNPNQLVEYYCAGDNVVASNIYTCPKNYECRNGACVQINNYCSDEDGGLDIYTTATVRNASASKIDTCVDSRRVKEYYCGDDYAIEYEIRDCPSGYECSNGKCIKTSGCTDYDNGIDIYTYSYTYTKDKGSIYDSCIDRNTVSEQYCENDVQKSQAVLCPNGYQCSNGKCIETCSETDGGDDPSIKGTTSTPSASETDYCSDYFTLVEYYCDNNTIKSKTYDAISMQECYKGEIVPAQCVDPDGRDGDNAYYKRTTVTRGHNLRAMDYCSGYNTLVEYTCVNNYISPVEITCDAGCDEGACKLPPIHFP